MENMGRRFARRIMLMVCLAVFAGAVAAISYTLYVHSVSGVHLCSDAAPSRVGVCVAALN